MRMRITVFGASGKVGRLVVSEALLRGHHVVAFVHKAHVAERPNLTIVTGDVHQAADIARAIAGSDVVISTLSSWGSPAKDILSTATRLLVPAMQQNKLTRIVTLTGNLARLPHERFNAAGQLLHKFGSILFLKVMQDAETHLQLLLNSQLDWTCLRAPIITSGKSTTYRLNDQLALIDSVSAAAVAQCIVDLIESDERLQQSPQIHGA